MTPGTILLDSFALRLVYRTNIQLDPDLHSWYKQIVGTRNVEWSSHRNDAPSSQGSGRPASEAMEALAHLVSTH